MGRNCQLPDPTSIVSSFLSNKNSMYLRLIKKKGSLLSLSFLLPVGWIIDVMAGASVVLRIEGTCGGAERKKTLGCQYLLELPYQLCAILRFKLERTKLIYLFIYFLLLHALNLNLN